MEKQTVFKVGDVVRVSGTESRFDGCIGKVDNTHETGDVSHYRATFEDSDFCWFDANDLELIERMSCEKSATPEQKALDFLLKQDDTMVHIFFKDEISDWVREFMSQKDYKNARQAIELLENLEKERK